MKNKRLLGLAATPCIIFSSWIVLAQPQAETGAGEKKTENRTIILYEKSGKAAFIRDGKIVGTADKFKPSKSLLMNGKPVNTTEPDTPEIDPMPDKPKPKDPHELDPPKPTPKPKDPDPCYGPACPGGTPIKSQDALIHYSPYKDLSLIELKKGGVQRAVNSKYMK